TDAFRSGAALGRFRFAVDVGDHFAGVLVELEDLGVDLPQSARAEIRRVDQLLHLLLATAVGGLGEDAADAWGEVLVLVRGIALLDLYDVVEAPERHALANARLHDFRRRARIPRDRRLVRDVPDLRPRLQDDPGLRPVDPREPAVRGVHELAALVYLRVRAE